MAALFPLRKRGMKMNPPQITRLYCLATFLVGAIVRLTNKETTVSSVENSLTILVCTVAILNHCQGIEELYNSIFLP